MVFSYSLIIVDKSFVNTALFLLYPLCCDVCFNSTYQADFYYTVDAVI